MQKLVIRLNENSALYPHQRTIPAPTSSEPIRFADDPLVRIEAETTKRIAGQQAEIERLKKIQDNSLHSKIRGKIRNITEPIKTQVKTLTTQSLPDQIKQIKLNHANTISAFAKSSPGISKVTNFLTKSGGPLTFALGAYESGTREWEQNKEKRASTLANVVKTSVRSAAGGGGALAGAIAGAKIGLYAGCFGGPWGCAIGAVGGAIVGGIKGHEWGDDVGDFISNIGEDEEKIKQYQKEAEDRKFKPDSLPLKPEETKETKEKHEQNNIDNIRRSMGIQVQ